MPMTDKHVEISLGRTGKDYAELHRWINDPDRQYERHDFNRVWALMPEVRARFGDEGVHEYIEHLRVDMEARFTDIWGEAEAVRDTALEYFGLRKIKADR